MGSVGDAHCRQRDVREFLRDPSKCELLDHPVSVQDTGRSIVRDAVFEFIEGFYNPRRRHSSPIGYLSPIDYERRHHAGQQSIPTHTSLPLRARGRQGQALWAAPSRGRP